MSDTEWKSPSKELCNAAEREALEKAYAALASLSDDNYENNPTLMGRALLAIKEVELKHSRKFYKECKKTGKNGHALDLNAFHILATASLVKAWGHNIDEWHPYAMCTRFIPDLVSAGVAVNLLGPALASLSDGSAYSGFFDKQELKKLLALKSERT